MKKTLLIKVKWSESHLVLSDSAIPCSLPGHSIHGILQARILEWVACSFLHGIFPTQGSNPDLPNCKQILYCLSYQGGPKILEWVTYPFSSGSSRPRNWTRISCNAGGFITSWATREAHSYKVGFATPWTVAHQTSLTMGFPNKSELPFPPPGDLPGPGNLRQTCVSCIGRHFLYHWATGEALVIKRIILNNQIHASILKCFPVVRGCVPLFELKFEPYPITFPFLP